MSSPSICSSLLLHAWLGRIIPRCLMVKFLSALCAVRFRTKVAIAWQPDNAAWLESCCGDLKQEADNMIVRHRRLPDAGGQRDAAVQRLLSELHNPAGLLRRPFPCLLPASGRPDRHLSHLRLLQCAPLTAATSLEPQFSCDAPSFLRAHNETSASASAEQPALISHAFPDPGIEMAIMVQFHITQKLSVALVLRCLSPRLEAGVTSLTSMSFCRRLPRTCCAPQSCGRRGSGRRACGPPATGWAARAASS